MAIKPKLLIATYNAGKVRELNMLLGAVPFALTTPQEEGLVIEVEETGVTFEENAILKATVFGQTSGLLTLADDSGLEVDVLGGAPGVHSARYAEPGATDKRRLEYLLENMEGIPAERRRGRFRCVMALAHIEGGVDIFHGDVEGIITTTSCGANGFGYDPVFFLPEQGCTMAQLTLEEKAQISHRGRAAALVAAALQRYSS